MLLYTTLFNKTDIDSKYLEESIPDFLDKTFGIPKDGFDFRTFVVTEEYIARPDLISYNAYGDSMYADIICKINGISNPFELNEGIELVIPSPEYIMNFTGRPADTDASVNSDSADIIAPVAKKPGEKRKANDAVVNDSRFKIDAASGIIIY